MSRVRVSASRAASSKSAAGTAATVPWAEIGTAASATARAEGGRALAAWYVLGAMRTPCPPGTRHIGSTPKRPRWASMNPTTRAVAGRAPARRTRTPPAGSRPPTSVHGPRPAAARSSARQKTWSRTPAGVDGGLLAPAPQRVRVHPDPRADPQHSRVQRQPGLLLTSLRDKPHRPLPQLVRVLPRCRHWSTRPWLQCLHQSRGGSDSEPRGTLQPMTTGSSWGPRAEPPAMNRPGIDAGVDDR
jgi:hypothetical protein